jgi:hypothetical protein
MDLVDMTGNQSDTPMAGMPRLSYIARLDDILTLRETAASPTTFAERVTIATAHVMKTGKKFTTLYCVKNKGMFESKSVGDMKFIASDTEVKVFIPGDTATMRGYLEEVQNADLILLVPDMNSANLLQLGDKHSPAQVKSHRFTKGGKAGDEYGLELVFSYDGLTPRVYTAAVPLTPGA